MQGAWGVVPAHLNELSPPEFRGTFPGLTYQIGNLISASSAQIETFLGERFPKDGKPNYGLAQGIFAACTMVLLIFFIATGKENKDINFDDDDDENNGGKNKDDENKGGDQFSTKLQEKNSSSNDNKLN